MLEEIKKEIEQVVEGYCDGTYQGLSHGHLIEYFGEGSNKTPQTLADEIMVVIKRHLTKRVPDAVDSATSQALSPQSGESTPEVNPAATQRR